MYWPTSLNLIMCTMIKSCYRIFYFFKFLHLRAYGTLGVFMSFYNKLEEIFIVYRLVHVLNIKKCNNDVYIQPANLSFNKHLLLVENSPIDKHRWKMELISCFSENKQTILILFDYNRVGTLNILMLSSHTVILSSSCQVKVLNQYMTLQNKKINCWFLFLL